MIHVHQSECFYWCLQTKKTIIISNYKPMWMTFKRLLPYFHNIYPCYNWTTNIAYLVKTYLPSVLCDFFHNEMIKNDYNGLMMWTCNFKLQMQIALVHPLPISTDASDPVRKYLLHLVSCKPRKGKKDTHMSSFGW